MIILTNVVNYITIIEPLVILCYVILNYALTTVKILKLGLLNELFWGSY